MLLPSLSGVLASGLAGLVRQVVGSLLHGLLVPVARYLLATPNLWAQPTLRTLWLSSVGVYSTLAVVLVMLAATASITGWSRAPVPLARLATTWLTAVSALPLVALEAQLADAVVGIFVPEGAGLVRQPAVATLVAAAAGSGTARLGLLVVAAVGTALLASLAVQALLRWAVLWALVVLAPLCMALGLLPGEGGPLVARLWWRLQAGAVFLPVADAVVLAVYAALFGSDTAGLTGALAGVGVLTLLARLPGWAAGQLGHPATRDVVVPLRRLAYDAARLAPSTRPLAVTRKDPT